MRRIVLSFALLSTTALFAQIPSGALVGRVVGPDGLPVPAAEIVLLSPALQGSRSTLSSTTGDFAVPFLPPGSYRVRCSAAGFQSLETDLIISAGQTRRLLLQLTFPVVREEVVVEAERGTISTTVQASTSLDRKLVESLPIGRSVAAVAALAAGTHATGPNGGLSISGGVSYEGAFLVNGAVINENLRGQPLDLFIEDAILQTTTITSGISAEYGRFSGGLVQALTRSGGNEIEGSLRLNLENDDWRERTPLTLAEDDETDSVLQATFGGFLARDRLWFFLAGRGHEETEADLTVVTERPFVAEDSQQRWEGKLTFTPHPRHSLVASWFEIDESLRNGSFGRVAHIEALLDRENRQDLGVALYTGMLSPRMFVQAQYSRRRLALSGGSPFTDRIRGTPVIDAFGVRGNAAILCGACAPEERNNRNLLAKAFLFLPTANAGSHDLVFGVDSFEDFTVRQGHLSGSDFQVLLFDSTFSPGPGGEASIGLNPLGTILLWNPITASSQGTRLRSDAVFLNDSWRIGRQWTVNLGVRWDSNEGTGPAGNPVADDDALSPRLGVQWESSGERRWELHAFWGRYVASLASNLAGQSAAAGRSEDFAWIYGGPPIPAGPVAESLERLFEWFDSVGGSENQSFLLGRFVPQALVIRDGLDSPFSEETTLGASRAFHGDRGTLRVDLVHRDYRDLYLTRIDSTTGTIRDDAGNLVDVRAIENDNDLLERTYDGIHAQAQYRWSDRISLGGSWTISRTHGNYEGETAGVGPAAASALEYPEYRDLAWSSPRGDLSVDQRQKIRAWGVWRLLDSRNHHLSVGALESFSSGTPYGAVGRVDPTPFVENPGYASPPRMVTYYFTDRDAFRTDNLHQTDLSVNYGFTSRLGGVAVEFFVQPEVINLFDEDGVVSVDTQVLDETRSRSLSSFNPFSEQPEEGVHWLKGPRFGMPRTPFDYQVPRTFRISVGVRF